MNEIYILFLILGTLFILENKSINLLAYYVGLVILLAVVISISPDLSNIYHQYGNGISYISYILILVQISALTILFGFIIMLFPNNSTDILIKQKNIPTKKINKPLMDNIILKILLIVLISSIFYYIINNYNHFKYLLNIITEYKLEIINVQDIQNIDNNTYKFLSKISYLLYGDPSNIFKFLVLTIILLFAIICLFFILFPTIYIL